jgi:phosphoribosylformylglycinamidine synthase
MRNSKMHFVCRMQHLRVERKDTAFTSAYARHQVIKVAIAHGEGNYTADEDTYARLEGENRVAFRYCDAQGHVGASNPNGSASDIAGIYSEKLNVLGLMPHPENLIDPLVGGTDGRGMFESLVAHLELAPA